MTVNTQPFFARLALTLALSFTGCSDDPENEGHDHDAGTDAGYSDDDDVPCDPGIPPLAPGLSQVGGASMKLKATLVSSDPTPLLKGSADWVVDFTTVDGTPVTDLEFTDVYTFMPVHGHKGTFKPKPMALAEPGRYSFDGLNFSMRGPWQIRFELASPTAGEDVVIFDVCVERK